MKANPKTVNIARNIKDAALRGAVAHNWRIATDKSGQTLILSNRPEGEK